MVKPRKLADVQEEYKDAVVGLCCVCSKPVPGWYGRYGDGGVCSKKCMLEQDKKEKFPEYPASAFEAKHGL